VHLKKCDFTSPIFCVDFLVRISTRNELGGRPSCGCLAVGAGLLDMRVKECYAYSSDKYDSRQGGTRHSTNTYLHTLPIVSQLTRTYCTYRTGRHFFNSTKSGLSFQMKNCFPASNGRHYRDVDFTNINPGHERRLL
jgi:hypothetical protein